MAELDTASQKDVIASRENVILLFVAKAPCRRREEVIGSLSASKFYYGSSMKQKSRYTLMHKNGWCQLTSSVAASYSARLPTSGLRPHCLYFVWLTLSYKRRQISHQALLLPQYQTTLHPAPALKQAWVPHQMLDCHWSPPLMRLEHPRHLHLSQALLKQDQPFAASQLHRLSESTLISTHQKAIHLPIVPSTKRPSLPAGRI